jgi:hypothetical protein
MATKSNRATAGRPGAAKAIKSTLASGPYKPKLPPTPDCGAQPFQPGARTIINGDRLRDRVDAAVAVLNQQQGRALGLGQRGRRPW